MNRLHFMNGGTGSGIVTNGTLLDRHAETVPDCLDKIYVSVDGPEQLHDSIRGAREHSGRSGRICLQ